MNTSFTGNFEHDTTTGGGWYCLLHTPFVSRIAIPYQPLTSHLRCIEYDAHTPLLTTTKLVTIFEIPWLSVRSFKRIRILFIWCLPTSTERGRPAMKIAERGMRSALDKVIESTGMKANWIGLIATQWYPIPWSSNPAKLRRWFGETFCHRGELSRWSIRSPTSYFGESVKDATWQWSIFSSECLMIAKHPAQTSPKPCAFLLCKVQLFIKRSATFVTKSL